MMVKTKERSIKGLFKFNTPHRCSAMRCFWPLWYWAPPYISLAKQLHTCMSNRVMCVHRASWDDPQENTVYVVYVVMWTALENMEQKLCILACWISSRLQSFDGSKVKDILTSLVATTSTDIPKSSKIEKTCMDKATIWIAVRIYMWQQEREQQKLQSNSHLCKEAKLTKHPRTNYI